MCEWYSIETAPKDGRRIIGYFVKPEYISVDWAFGAAETFYVNGRWVNQPYKSVLTHWMPFPDPPQKESK